MRLAVVYLHSVWIIAWRALALAVYMRMDDTVLRCAGRV
jgi:hypothetical protein